MDWTGKQVLVTGGAGFIGRHLCEALSRAGAHVEAWARPGGARGVVPTLLATGSIAYRDVDVRDRAGMVQALAERPPAVVFHLAGMRLMGNHAGHLARMFETHVLGTLNLLGALATVERVVVVGSCEEYGRGPVPFSESQPALPQTAYAITRLATTQACMALAEPAVCLARLAVVYGPGQTGDMFIPSLMASSTAGRPFAMTTGEQSRDFVFVDDAVDALMALAGSDAAQRQIVNVGSGVEITVRRVAETVARLAGPTADIRFGAIPSRPGEASRYVCAIDGVRRLTAWRPRIDLEDGLARTMKWWQTRQAQG